jgi:Glycosyltransferase family 87
VTDEVRAAPATQLTRRTAPGSWWPVLVWAVLRLAGLLLVSGASFYPQVDDDVQYHYYLWATLVLRHGLWPWKSFAVDYPPGVLPLMVIPGGVKVYELEFMVLAFVADALVARMLMRPGSSQLALWGWILLPVVLGPVMWVRLDVFVAVAILGFVRCVEQERWRRAGLCIAAATLLKLWPAALLVLVFPLVGRRSWARTTGTAASAVAVATLPVLLWGGGPGLWAMVRTQGGRGLEIETVWAAPAVIAHGLGAAVGIGPGEGSPVIVLPGWAVWIASFMLPLLLCILVAHVWRLRQQQPSIRAVTAVGIALVLLGTKVLSPQYIVWAAAAVLLVLDGGFGTRRQRTVLVTATAALAIATQWLYPYAYQALGSSAIASQSAAAVHAVVVLIWVFVVLATLGDLAPGANKPVVECT